MNNADKPAFPVQGHNYDDPNGGFFHVEHKQGLTKRERFAMAAMQGLLASGLTYEGETTNRGMLAMDAIAHADALLKELEETE